MDKNFFQKASHFQLILLLIIFGYFFLIFGNNVVSLTHPDEVFYAQSVKEMVQHKSWLTPMIFGAPQFEKPIMFYLMMAFLVKLFGMSPFIARFWPGFFGVLGLCVTYWISWMLFDKKRLAFLSGMILGTSFIYLALSRAVLTDVVFSIWIAISIGFFLRAYKYNDKKTSSIILFFIFAAIAVLTKGLLGFTFTMATALIFLVCKRDFNFLRNKGFFIGLLLFLAISLPWHILMYKMYGSWFVDEYFKNVHIRRLLEAEHPKLNTWYFYLVLMIAGVIPWIFLSVPAWFSSIKKVLSKTDDRDSYFFLFSWIIGIFIFVEPAKSKLASYIFPAFPAIAMLISAYLEEKMENFEEGKMSIAVSVCGYMVSFVLLSGSFAAIILGRKHLDVLFSMTPMYIVSVIAFLIATIFFILNMMKKQKALIYAHISITAALLICLLFARPYVEPWVSCKEVGDALNGIDKSDSVVIASKFYVRGIRFYTGKDMAVIAMRDKGFFSPHPMPFLNTKEKTLNFLKTQNTTYAVVKDDDVDELKGIIKGKPYTLDNLYGKAGKFILRIDKIKPLKKY